MNLDCTQAAGLSALLTPPPVSHDKEVMRSSMIGRRTSYESTRMDLMACIAQFIGTSSLLECKHILNEIADHVSEITGCASEIEDASCSLTEKIKAQNEEPPLCAHCNGSGEGQYDGTRCPVCRGRGTELRKVA